MGRACGASGVGDRIGDPGARVGGRYKRGDGVTLWIVGEGMIVKAGTSVVVSDSESAQPSRMGIVRKITNHFRVIEQPTLLAIQKIPFIRTGRAYDGRRSSEDAGG